jgi:hypothetical protein
LETQMSNPDCAEASKQPTKPRKKNALAHGIYSIFFSARQCA